MLTTGVCAIIRAAKSHKKEEHNLMDITAAPFLSVRHSCCAARRTRWSTLGTVYIASEYNIRKGLVTYIVWPHSFAVCASCPVTATQKDHDYRSEPGITQCTVFLARPSSFIVLTVRRIRCTYNKLYVTCCMSKCGCRQAVSIERDFVPTALYKVL